MMMTRLHRDCEISSARRIQYSTKMFIRCTDGTSERMPRRRESERCGVFQGYASARV